MIKAAFAKRSLASLTLAVAAFMASTGGAYARSLELIGEIKESYHSSSQMSVQSGAALRPSGALVALGERAEKDEPFSLRNLAVGSIPHAERLLCVVMNTRDGSYWGRARFKITAPVAGAETIDWASDYKTELGRFSVEDILVFARVAQDCDKDRVDAVAPIRLSSSSELLVAHVAASAARPSVRLMQGGDMVARARCRRASTSVSTHRCAASLKGVTKGRYRLLVELRGDAPGHDLAEIYEIAID